MSKGPIWVIIPIYNQPALVEQCIESVLSAECTIPFTLCLIDDASTDPTIGRLLENYEKNPRVICIRNTSNLGFTKTANKGIRAAGNCHPMLLNSDTIVYDHWLDEMVTALRSHPKVCSVTAMSNQGGSHLTCYPDPPTSPVSTLGDEDALIAAAAYDVCSGVVARIHSGVGFCILFNRACLDEIGLLDHINFPRGYCEETDLCYRASYLGWHHLVAVGCYVTHLHGQSFGAEKAELMKNMLKVFRSLHPIQPALDKSFRKRDPLKHLRRKIDLGRLKRHLGGSAKIALIGSKEVGFHGTPHLKINDDEPSGSTILLQSETTRFPNVDPYDVGRDMSLLKSDLRIAGVREMVVKDHADRFRKYFQIVDQSDGQTMLGID